MTKYILAAVALHLIIALLLIAQVLRRRKEPTSMLAWILGIFFLPCVGSLLYGIFGEPRIQRSAKKKRKSFAKLAGLDGREPPAYAEPELPSDLQAVEKLGRELTGMTATGGNAVEVYHDAEATYAALEEAIRAAERSIHLEFYIWENDETGNHFRDVVIEKAREGVECRVLLDAMGCFFVPDSYAEPMIEAGVEFAWFLPTRPWGKRWGLHTLHLRNHRKIAVMDGRTAFFGSQNIGDEYRGKWEKFSPWHDTQLRVQGPAALALQHVFAEDWHFATGKTLDHDRHFPKPECPGSSVVQILPTGPTQDVRVVEQILFGALSSARKTIRIATPYFVPSPVIRAALMHAGYRGLSVRVVLPQQSDRKFILWTARSFYEELLEAGVEICELPKGMLHSKVVTVDEQWTMAGSVNMDIRSFRLNFEVTGMIYDSDVVKRISSRIDEHCANARQITLEDVAGRSYSNQLLIGAARLCSPLL